MCYATWCSRAGSSGSSTCSLEVGASGLIVPDLPLEEAPATLAALRCSAGSRWCRWSRRRLPTSAWRSIGARARGFLYTVSVTGTTGERADARRRRLSAVIARARAQTEVPVAVGFGIGTPEQAAAAAAAGPTA